MRRPIDSLIKFVVICFAGLGVYACSTGNYPDAPIQASDLAQNTDYLIGPGDNLQIFVWRHEDLSSSVPVRPDGRISIPLIDDLQAAGKTPTDLGKDIEGRLNQYVQEPLVTVIVTGFLGPYGEQIRIVGAGVTPQAIPYRDNMTLLDAVIAVGGLNQFAAGNNAKIWRRSAEDNNIFRVRLDDLLKDGDLSANVALVPGDVLIIPESFF